MTLRRYYPLTAASSGGTVITEFGIFNMFDTLQDALDDPIQKATASPSGGLTYQFSAVVGGGTPPYTYTWSTGGGQIAVSDTTVFDPVFSGSGTGSPGSKRSSFSLTASDSATPPATATKYIDIQFYFGQSIP